VDTPYSGAAKVVCYRDTWEAKLAHRVPGRSRAMVERALASPSYVAAGTSNESYIAFVDLRQTSARSGSPLW
jgi:hypothetical protein